jgi:hypothetical protein
MEGHDFLRISLFGGRISRRSTRGKLNKNSTTRKGSAADAAWKMYSISSKLDTFLAASSQVIDKLQRKRAAGDLAGSKKKRSLVSQNCEKQRSFGTGGRE